MVDAKSYGWENRVKFIVKFMYDIDNNGRYSLFLSFLFYSFIIEAISENRMAGLN